MSMVIDIARRLRDCVPPSVTLEDLVSAGTIGLIQAVDRFDPALGFKFATFAKHRIRGAMLDFLRGEDPLSRAERQRVSAAGSNLSATGYNGAQVNFTLDEVSAGSLATPAQPDFVVRSEVSHARLFLSGRENQVITLLYEAGWGVRRVAANLGVNESRVSQIKGQAIGKLRGALATLPSRAPTLERAA